MIKYKAMFGEINFSDTRKLRCLADEDAKLKKQLRSEKEHSGSKTRQ